jgi:hypothetical protein
MKNLITILTAVIFTSISINSYSSCKQPDIEIKSKSFDSKDGMSDYLTDVERAYLLDHVKENIITANSSSISENSEINSSSSVDCDKFIQEYTAFVNSYIKVMKKYKANPSDPTILSEYTKAAQKASKLQSNASNCNDSKYAAKIMELSNKIAKALM